MFGHKIPWKFILKQLEGALGRKTLENEILKEALDFAKAKKWIAYSPVLPGDEQ